MPETQEYDELMLDIAAMAETAHRLAMEDAASGQPDQEPQDFFMETLMDYQGLDAMHNAINKPLWTHLNALRRGLSDYLNQIETNQESMSSYGSTQFMAFERQAIPIIRALIDRTTQQIHPMYNNADGPEPVEDPWIRAQRLLEASQPSP